MSSILRSSTSVVRSARSRAPIAVNVVSSHRSIHSSTIRRASETPQDPFADPAFKAFRDKVQGHQGAVDAMLALGKIMEDKGYDTTKKPGMAQMAKMAMDSDLRAAAQGLMTELQKAGINPQDAMEMFQKATSKP